MTEGGSVWDTGPQYPEMSPEQAERTSPQADATSTEHVSQDVPQDTTPTMASPVDIDTPIPAKPPVVPTEAPPPKKGPKPPGWWQRTVVGFPVWLLLTFAAVILVIFLVIARSGDPGNSADRVPTTDAATTIPSQVLTTTVAPATTAAPPTTAPAPTTASPLFTLPNAPVTVPPTAPAIAPVTAPATQPPATAPGTAAPTVPPATLPPDGPVITIIGSVGSCSYGSQCLLAGFALHNFDSQPSEFVCEFSDGSRYTFHFNRQEVERACATGNSDGSITIEVDGVRSATFTRP